MHVTLLKLSKFGNLSDFAESVKKGLREQQTQKKLTQTSPTLQQPPSLPKSESPKPQKNPILAREGDNPSDPPLPSQCSRVDLPKRESQQSQMSSSKDIQYSVIAKNTDKMKMGFSIRLVDCGNESDPVSPG